MMIDYRFNEVTQKWMIISPKRAHRPGEGKREKSVAPPCPFCYGHESMTPPEVYRLGGGKPNESGWKVRVVPNKYRITEIHEVIIHSPKHSLDLEDIDDSQIDLIFQAYQDRYNFYQRLGQVIIFNNTGKGGAESLEHSHSQLTVVPFDYKLETPVLGKIENIAYEDHYLTLFAPQTVEWPYEVWLAPKRRHLFFGEINHKERSAFGKILKKVIRIIEKKIGDFSYNYYLYPAQDWYLRLIPRISERGGFELATGIMVNIQDPKEVISLLQKSF